MFPVLCENLFGHQLFFSNLLSGPDEVCPCRFGYFVPMAFVGGGPCLFFCKIWYFAFPFRTNRVLVEGASGGKSGDWFIPPLGLCRPGPFLVVLWWVAVIVLSCFGTRVSSCGVRCSRFVLCLGWGSFR